MKYIVIKHHIEETVVEAEDKEDALTKLTPDTKWSSNGWTEVYTQNNLGYTDEEMKEVERISL
jgi:hypothetical protein